VAGGVRVRIVGERFFRLGVINTSRLDTMSCLAGGPRRTVTVGGGSSLQSHRCACLPNISAGVHQIMASIN